MGNWISTCLQYYQPIELNGRYFRITPLSEGGFSMVFKAIEIDTGNQYAIKRITCSDEETVREALIEAELYRLFNHPNLIKCEESCVVPAPPFQHVYIAFPLYSRGTLQDLINVSHYSSSSNRTPIPERLLKNYFQGICEGVKMLHFHRRADTGEIEPLAHRDIKPGNVLLADDDTPILMDFGSMTKARITIQNRKEAVAQQDLAAEKSTMPYRAPELFEVKSQCILDERVDIWSLGCTLYAAAYGASPFEQLNAPGSSVALAALSGQIKFPPDTYSQTLKDLIRFMVVVDPQQRPFIDQVIDRVKSWNC